MWGKGKDTRLLGESEDLKIVSLFDWRCRRKTLSGSRLTYECMPTHSTCYECIRRPRYTAVGMRCDLYTCPCVLCASRYEIHSVSEKMKLTTVHRHEHLRCGLETRVRQSVDEGQSETAFPAVRRESFSFSLSLAASASAK